MEVRMPDQIDDELESMEKALEAASERFGEHSLQVAELLDKTAAILKSRKLRTLDAANMLARANAIRQKGPSLADVDGLKSLLDRYIGINIGLNYKDMDKFHKVKLVKAAGDFFSVRIANGRAVVHFPYRQILYIAESPDLKICGDSFAMTDPTVPLVIQVFVMATSTSSVGFGFVIS
jgi:hypothetical protein